MKKPLFIVNNLPSPVELEICGRPVPIQAFGVSGNVSFTSSCNDFESKLFTIPLVTSSEAFASVNGLEPLEFRKQSFKAVTGSELAKTPLPWEEDAIAPFSDPQAGMPDLSKGCSSNYCSCLARMAAFDAFEKKFGMLAAEQNQSLPPAALKQLYGSRFSQSTVIRTSDAGCFSEPPGSPKSFLSAPGKVFLATLSAPVGDYGIDYPKPALSKAELLPQYSIATSREVMQDKTRFGVYGSWPS